MHPILGKSGRLGLFLVTWVTTATLFLSISLDPGDVSLSRWMLFVVPLATLHAFISLAAWFPCRVTPLRSSGLSRIVTTHLLGAVVISLGWSACAFLLAYAADLIARQSFSTVVSENTMSLLGLGAILYVVSVTLFYLIIEFENARNAENKQSELTALAREAELSALRARIDPHFLFNSLNAVASLCGSDPSLARRMSILLAEFLRSSLRMDGQRTIPLADEWRLGMKYLEIEKVRFGDRMVVEAAIDERAGVFPVPPLILQPLLENAVKHGISGLVEGGTIRVQAHEAGGKLHLEIENPIDEDRSTIDGEGIGLANVTRRLDVLYGREASLERRLAGGLFCVFIVLPRLEEGKR